jgi:hypothetical protein
VPEAVDISLFINKVWYQNFQPELWNQIGCLYQSSNPEINMRHVVLSKALSEQIMIDPNSDGFYQGYQLDQLKIPNIEVFPDTIKPSMFSLRERTNSLKREPVMKGVQEKMCLIDRGNVKTGVSRIKSKIVNLPMSLYSLNGKPNHYRSRIMIPNSRDKYAEQLTGIMDFLLWYLIMCHKQLISAQISKGMNLLSDAMEMFKEWFYEVLFETKDNYLPIFGDVIDEEGFFQKSDFSKLGSA